MECFHIYLDQWECKLWVEAGGAVVIEVRRQFKKFPGIMKRKQKPDYARLVDLLTVAAIKR